MGHIIINCLKPMTKKTFKAVSDGRAFYSGRNKVKEDRRGSTGDKGLSSNVTSTPLSLLSYLSVTSPGGTNSSFMSHVYDYSIFCFEEILFKGLSCI